MARARRAPAAPTVGPASLADLRGAPYNPRRISEEAAAGLGTSLTKFGDIAGITYNLRTGHLVTGHQRVTQLGAKYGDLPIVDGAITTPDGHRFAVRVVDWDEATEKTANVAANNPHVGGTFDETIEGLLREVQGLDLDLFGGLQLDDLLETLTAPEPDALDLSVDDAFGLKVIVECESEEQLTTLIERLTTEGFECRALIA